MGPAMLRPILSTISFWRIRVAFFFSSPDARPEQFLFARHIRDEYCSARLSEHFISDFRPAISAPQRARVNSAVSQNTDAFPSIKRRPTDTARATIPLTAPSPQMADYHMLCAGGAISGAYAAATADMAFISGRHASAMTLCHLYCFSCRRQRLTSAPPMTTTHATSLQIFTLTSPQISRLHRDDDDAY